jgi:glycosyltransferase involved in cell wall biosynthesis
MEIHQLLPGYQYGDAISNHAAALRGLLRSWGHSSEIYSQHIGPNVAHDCRHIREFHGRHDDITIYHYSIGADELSDLFLTTPGKRLFVYHNITPHQYFADYDESEYSLTKKGRDMLGEFRDAADMVLADSPFNCQELAALGFRSPRILPILIDYAAFESTEPCRATLSRFNDDWANFLFVGRLAPNKRQEDVIRVFAHYNEFIDRRSRLFLVGSDAKDTYVGQLRCLIRSLEVEDHVELPGHVHLSELIAYYKLADVFLCMSDHEGFCVPFLEAFYHKVPVLAYKSSAVPETLGIAGILFTQRDYGVISEMAHLLITDEVMRAKVLVRGRERLSEFEPRAIARRFRGYLDMLLAA